MPLVRGSSMMSLGTWTRRSTKYQKFLNLSNVFLLIVSTGLLFSSIVLMTFYHLTKMYFWSWYFYALPICMLTLGLYTFSVSVYGFLISTRESKGLISLIAVFLSLAFLGQMFSVFTAVELRNIIDLEELPNQQIHESMQLYVNNTDSTVVASWDALQTQLRCCGGLNYERGYREWGYVNYHYSKDSRGSGQDVPDSCCHVVKPGCGVSKLNERKTFDNLGIWKDGCVEILLQKFEDDVKPFLMVYALLGVLMAIVELVTVVLACAYVAQINRRDKRNQHTWERTGGNTHNEEEYLPALTSKETNF